MTSSAVLFPNVFQNATPRDEEQVLLARCRVGERAAFDVLLDRYRERVLNLAFQLLHDRHAAEDIAQEVFVRAFSQIHNFRGEAALFTWLYQITLNECRARQRRLKPMLNFDDCDDNFQTGSTPGPSTPEAGAIEKLALERALNHLSPPLRVALILREMHGLSYEEIARVLKLPVGTVRSRLHKGRKQFQENWDKE
jgi:RNA polymerase sigma-70 factor (ECF subfamily)